MPGFTNQLSEVRKVHKNGLLVLLLLGSLSPAANAVGGYEGAWSPDAQGVDLYACGAEASVCYGSVPGSVERTQAGAWPRYFPLTGSRASFFTPVWSPDGKSIMFQVGKMVGDELRWEIWVVDAAGGEPRRVVSETAASEYVYFLRNMAPAAEFTRDGAGVVFTSVASGVASAARVTLAGGRVQELAPAPSLAGSLSPDGRLSYVSLAGREERVVVRDLAAAKQREIGG